MKTSNSFNMYILHYWKRDLLNVLTKLILQRLWQNKIAGSPEETRVQNGNIVYKYLGDHKENDVKKTGYKFTSIQNIALQQYVLLFVIALYLVETSKINLKM